MFNAFTDPAPDRWGPNLLARRERKSAQAEKRRPRTLLDIDYLTLVEDKNRLGALRFADTGSEEFLATSDQPVPPLVNSAGCSRQRPGSSTTRKAMTI